MILVLAETTVVFRRRCEIGPTRAVHDGSVSPLLRRVGTTKWFPFQKIPRVEGISIDSTARWQKQNKALTIATPAVDKNKTAMKEVKSITGGFESHIFSQQPQTLFPQWWLSLGLLCLLTTLGLCLHGGPVLLVSSSRKAERSWRRTDELTCSPVSQ